MIRSRLYACALTLLAPIVFPGTVRAGGGLQPPASSGKTHWVTLLGAPAIQRPTGLAIDLRGNPRASKWAYTADAATRRIVKFGTGGKVLLSWQYGDRGGAGPPAALAVGGSGNLFVADPVSGTVSKYSPNGILLSRWSGFATPRGVTLDGAGNVYIADAGTRSVVKLSPAGVVLARWTTHSLWPPGGTPDPTGIAFYPPDSIYVSTVCTIRVTCNVGSDLARQGDVLEGLLQFLAQGPRSGYLKQVWFGLGHRPNGTPDQGPYKEGEPFVTIDSMNNDKAGNLYVAGTLWPLGGRPARGVLAYQPTGYKWGSWSLPSQGTAWGIAVDSQGTIYVSQDSHILKLVR